MTPTGSAYGVEPQKKKEAVRIGTASNEVSPLLRYLPVFTYWMQSPWFLNVPPFLRNIQSEPPALH